MPKAVFVYHDRLSRHVLRHDHPLKPERLRMTAELLDAYGAFQAPGAELAEPRPATEAELLLVHAQEYVDAVGSISRGERSHDPARYNFDPYGDNPPFKGMFDAAALSTGASLVAAEAVASGRAPAAFSISGGLHHAARDHASGFCVFNDPAVAIAWLVRRGLRVAYVDIDAHHGDGVQSAFYDSDRVLTISLHQSGRYLFPGTGEATEQGTGTGRGYSVNLPLFPYTGDEVYLSAFEAIVPPLLTAFKPDVLALQLGVDAHYLDPLAQLQLTTATYHQAVSLLLGLGYPVVAMGGGGYHLTTVARVWALEYGPMLGVDWPDQVPAAFRDKYHVENLRDTPPPSLDPEMVEQTRRFAEAGIDVIRREVFPIHGL